MNSDFNNIKNYSAEDIRRYWNNEMAPPEMHALEMAAMDDPFLADALEGYSKLQKDPSDDIAMFQKRLTARSSGAPVVQMRKNNWWMVAAAIFLFIGLGTAALLMMPAKESAMAKNEPVQDTSKPPPAIAPTDKESNQQIEGPSFGLTVTKESKDNIPDFAKVKSPAPARDAKSVPLNIDSNRSFLAASEIPSLSDKDLNYKKEVSPTSPVSGSYRKLADTLSAGIASRNREEETLDRRVQQGGYYNNFSGNVVDPQNRSIPFATVKMNNANQVAAADRYGYFQFKSRDTIAEISVSSAGYEEKYITMNSRQAGLNITLDPLNNKGKLSEVGVKSVGKKSQGKQTQLQVYIMDAEPVIGWEKYSQYIDSNKKIPPTEPILSGEVVLSFKVNQKGELSSFEVEKSLNKTYDNEAIRLIKQGPSWKVTKGRKAKVKLIVKF